MVAITSLPLPGYMVKQAEEKDGILDKAFVFKLWHMGQKKVYYFQVENRDSLDK